MNDSDIFEGREPVAGLEYLGRAIVDANGQPSGSPANYEATRGADHPAGLPIAADADAAIAAISAMFPRDNIERGV